MKRTPNILLVIFLLFSILAHAQETKVEKSYITTDSLPKLKEKPALVQGKYNKKIQPDSVIAFKPDPMKVVWMGAIIPGYGQIMNRKYWKLPIVYAGFLGCTYSISWNGSRYSAYKTAYKDIIGTDPNATSYLDILPAGYTVEMFGGKTAYTAVLKTAMEKFRYNRDLSIIVSVGYYAITLVDAYVDAQLYDFDISTDLSMHFSPTLMENRYGVANTVGLKCRLCLK